jgi:hypothetical protein
MRMTSELGRSHTHAQEHPLQRLVPICFGAQGAKLFNSEVGAGGQKMK